MEASPANEGAAERDTADDWRIEPQRSVATVAELEGRIDVALATARTAEEAALEIGAASLEAAEQARRAAALAERASAAAARAASEVASAPPALAPSPRPSEPRPPFTARASVEPAAAVREPIAPTPIAEPSEPVPPTAVAAASEPVAPVMSSAPMPLAPPRPASRPARRQPDPFDERLTAFRQRAESVMIRLQKLESGAPPSDGPSEVVRLR
jgi:hypothetical protein